MNNPTPVLYKQDEQAITLDIEIQFKRAGINYRVEGHIDMVFALASIPCEECKKSSRDMLKRIGIEIDEDNMKVNMMEVVSNIPDDDTRLKIDEANVFVFIDAWAEKITNTDSMTHEDADSQSCKEMSAYMHSVLVGKVVCDGCFSSTYFESLLSNS